MSTRDTNDAFATSNNLGSDIRIEHERLLPAGWRLDSDGCYRKGEVRAVVAQKKGDQS